MPIVPVELSPLPSFTHPFPSQNKTAPSDAPANFLSDRCTPAVLPFGKFGQFVPASRSEMGAKIIIHAAGEAIIDLQAVSSYSGFDGF